MSLIKRLSNFTTKQLIIIVVLLASIMVLLRNQLKGVFNWSSSGLASVGTTLTNEQAKAIASTLKEAFANWIPYSSFNTVVKELSKVSLADYYAIKQAFGLVARDFSGAPAEDITSHLYTDKNLTEWLKLELSQSQIQELKSINLIFLSLL